MRAAKLAAFAFALFALIFFAKHSALGNGGKGKKIIYAKETKMGQNAGDICKFSSEIERVLFGLNSVQNKYKVVRIKIENESQKPLRLSKAQDKIELVFPDRSIPGILDLSKHDPTIWDAFDEDTRKALVYPAIVEAGEEENIFVFVADPKLAQLPQGFRYTIDSLSEKLVFIPDITRVAKY